MSNITTEMLSGRSAPLAGYALQIQANALACLGEPGIETID